MNNYIEKQTPSMSTETENLPNRAAPGILSGPIRCTLDIYQVNKSSGIVTHNDYPRCDNLSRIFCKIDVTSLCNFKTISKVVLKIRKYSGSVAGMNVYPATSNNSVALVAAPTNYLSEIEQNGNSYVLIDVSSYIKNSESKTLYIAIQSDSGNYCSLYNTGFVEMTYIEDDDLINSGKVEKEFGSKGNYSVNLRNGKLHYTQHLYSSMGELMPLNLSLTYNSADCDNSAPNGISCGIKGWTINYAQSLCDDSADILYMDGKHIIHRFKKSKNNAQVYNDATGKNGLILTSTNTERQISDGKTTSMQFDSIGRLVEITNSNTPTPLSTSIDYLTSDSMIWRITDGMGDLYSFNYFDGQIVIKKGSTPLVELTLTGELLTSIRYCLSNQTVTFAYNSNNQLISVTDSASNQKLKFEYTTAKSVSAIKQYVSKTSDSAQESCFLEYGLLQTRTYLCRNSDNKNNKYSTMIHSFAQDGKFLSSSEETDSGTVPVTTLTQRDFEVGLANIPSTSVTSFDINGYAIQESVSSEPIIVDTTEQDYDTYIFAATAEIIATVTDSMEEVAPTLYVVLKDGSKTLTTLYFDTSKRYEETLFSTVKLSPAVHNLSVDVVVENTKMGAIINNVNLYSTRKDNTKQYLNVNTGSEDITEKLGNERNTWYENLRGKLLCGNITVENIKYTYKDYLLTTISRLKNPTSFNVWYNDGECLLYGVNSAQLLFNETSHDIEDVTCCILSSTKGKNTFEYAIPNQQHFLTLRKNVCSGNDNLLSEDVVDQYFKTITSTDGHGIVTSFEYNSKGLVTSTTVSHPDSSLLNVVEESTYNSQNLLSSTKTRRYFTDYTHSYYYSEDYSLISEKDANDQAINYTYSDDSNEKLSKISSTLAGANQTCENTIDYDGDRVEQLEHNNSPFTFTYDERNNISNIKIAGKTLATNQYVYNQGGTTDIITVYGNGQKIKKYYDKYNRLIKVSDVTTAEQVKCQYIYSDTEIDTSLSDPTTASVSVSTKSQLRVVVDHMAGTNTWYTYDSSGQLIKTSNSKLTTSVTKDSCNRTNTISQQCEGTTTTTTYTYASQTDDTLQSEQTTVGQNRITTNYIRDALQRPIETSITVNGNGYSRDIAYIPRQTRTQLPNPGGGGGGTIEPWSLNSIGYKTETVGTTYYPSLVTTKELRNNSAVETESLSLTYDANGNITTYGYNTYTYDKFNRLTRENNYYLDKTITWEYDVGGNITSRKEYALTTSSILFNPTKTDSYTYGSDWKDQLTSFCGKSCIYDLAGNPTTYKGDTLTWEGRLLKTYRKQINSSTISMNYTADGLRISKTVSNSSTSEYTYNGSTLVREKITYSNGQTHNLTFLYNGEGLTGLVHNTTLYTYRKNLFGDIIAIYQGNTKVADYYYDAYGNCSVITNSLVGLMNPFRYRGYYYDSDLGLYYLQSRYYDPQTGRFINADDVSYLDPETIHGLNLYAYCLNNPVMYVDPVGHFVISIGIAASSALVYYALVALGVVGATTAVAYLEKETHIIENTVNYIVDSTFDLDQNTLHKSDSYDQVNSLPNNNVADFTYNKISTFDNINFIDNVVYYKRKKVAPRIRSKSKKIAKEKAFLKGGRRPPIHHPNGKHGPHFHPNDPRFKHWHYYYLWLLLFGYDD